jgi:phosphomannomutase
MKNKIVLFDMDGTLTESRKEFNSKTLENCLYQLTNTGVHIGIITGSDLDYLQEQMGTFLKNSSCRYKTHLLPCNGTKYLKPPEFATGSHKLVHDMSMRKHLGESDFRNLMQEIIYSQVDISSNSIPLTGHFINYRGSMINWCPIGRNANSNERERFVMMDKEEKIRLRVLSELKSMLELKDLSNKITIKLGGDTSFDIYPKGWDKTYGLKHFPNWETWFVGDRCYENGNDFEIYQKCLGKSYETTGPSETVKIIEEIILNLKGLK